MIIENSAYQTLVGITAFSEDKDLSNNAVTYSLTNNPNNLFDIDPNTGVVTVYGVLDYETSNSHNITVTASSADGSSDSSDFQINVLNDQSDDLNNDNEEITNFEINGFELVFFNSEPEGNIADGWPISFSSIVEEFPTAELLFIKISGVADENVGFLSLNIVAQPSNNTVNKSIDFTKDYKDNCRVEIFEIFLPFSLTNFKFRLSN